MPTGTAPRRQERHGTRWAGSRPGECAGGPESARGSWSGFRRSRGSSAARRVGLAHDIVSLMAWRRRGRSLERIESSSRLFTTEAQRSARCTLALVFFEAREDSALLDRPLIRLRHLLPRSGIRGCTIWKFRRGGERVSTIFAFSRERTSRNLLPRGRFARNVCRQQQSGEKVPKAD